MRERGERRWNVSRASWVSTTDMLLRLKRAVSRLPVLEHGRIAGRPREAFLVRITRNVLSPLFSWHRASENELDRVARTSDGNGWRRLERRKGRVAIAGVLFDLWRYRDLLTVLAGRDIRVRYKQTLLGVLWAVLQPLLVTILFVSILGRATWAGGLLPQSVPYPLFVLSGLLPWQLVSYAVTSGGTSLLSNQTLVTKVYFPRIIIPVASVACGIVDLGVAFAPFMAYLTWSSGGWRGLPGAAILVLPAFAALAVVLSIALAVWISALTVEYRDVRYTLPFVVQLWFFATPIVYPGEFLRGGANMAGYLFSLNPLVLIVEGTRWALLGTEPPDVGTIMGGTCVTLFVLMSGLWFFQKVERSVADVI